MADKGWFKESRRHREAYYKHKRNKVLGKETAETLAPEIVVVDFWANRVRFTEEGLLPSQTMTETPTVREPPAPTYAFYRLGGRTEGRGTTPRTEWVKQDVDTILTIFEEAKRDNQHLKKVDREMVVDPTGLRFYLVYRPPMVLVGFIGVRYSEAELHCYGLKSEENTPEVGKAFIKGMETTPFNSKTTIKVFLNPEDVISQALFGANGYLTYSTDAEKLIMRKSIIREGRNIITRRDEENAKDFE